MRGLKIIMYILINLDNGVVTRWLGHVVTHETFVENIYFLACITLRYRSFHPTATYFPALFSNDHIVEKI